MNEREGLDILAQAKYSGVNRYNPLRDKRGKIMNIKGRKFITSLAVAGTVLGSGAGLAACSSAPGTTSTPPTADSVLKADGYPTILVNESPSTVAATFGSAGAYVTTAAAGLNSSGSMEVVLVAGKPGGSSIIAAAVNDPSFQSQLTGNSGVTDSVSGDVMRLDGTVAQFSASPMGSGS